MAKIRKNRKIQKQKKRQERIKKQGIAATKPGRPAPEDLVDDALKTVQVCLSL